MLYENKRKQDDPPNHTSLCADLPDRLEQRKNLAQSFGCSMILAHTEMKRIALHSVKQKKQKPDTYRCGLNIRLILETWSFSQSSSSSPWSMLSFLLLGLIGGGPVRWLVRTEDTGRDCILGSPLRAASPAGRQEVRMNTTGRREVKQYAL